MIKSRLIVSICAAIMLFIPMIAAHDSSADTVPPAALKIQDQPIILQHDANGFDFTFGYQFTVTNDCDVYALGIWDPTPNDNLSGTYTVAIFDESDQSIVAQKEVPAGGWRYNGEGYYKYANLDQSAQLLTTKSYQIGAIKATGPSNWVSKATLTEVHPWVNLGELDLLHSGPTLAYMNDDWGPRGSDYRTYYSPNFLITPVPGAVWLLGSGLVGLIAIRRSRKKR